MEKAPLLFVAFCVRIVIAAGISLLLGWPVMWLWNYLCPSVFGLPTIGYWEAVCLQILCSILFKSSGSSGSSS